MRVDTGKQSTYAEIDWRKLVLDESAQGLELIDSLAKRRFNHGVLAEEAATYVIEHLAENNWQRCSNFKGNSQAKTYLHSLIVNLLEEFSRKRFGRPRPPAWLKRQGELWINLWKQLCLERQSLPELLHRYEQTGLYQREWIEQVARVIKARIPRCGEYRFEAPNMDSITNLTSLDADNQVIETPEDHLCRYPFEMRAETELFLVIQAVLQVEPSNDIFSEASVKKLNNDVCDVHNKLTQLRESLVLSDEEIIVLRMVYADGLSKKAVSRALGLPSHQAGLIVNKAMTRIRSAVEKCELDLASLLEKI
jgi:DNA-directed RNA polymerase specialized sigma24 family protein